MLHSLIGRSTMVALAASTFVPLGAQSESGVEQAREAPAQRWAAHGGINRCVLSRVQVEPFKNIFSLRMVPGTGRPQLLISADAWRGSAPDRGDELKIVTDPPTHEFPALVQESRVGADRSVMLLLGGAFVRGLGQASRFTVSAGGGRTRAAFEVPGAADAVAVFNACLEQTLRVWGMEAVNYDSIATMPRLVNRELTRYTSSPMLSGEEDATVVVRLSISANGAVTACQVVASGGNEAMNSETCRALLARARYRPAIDRNGTKVPIEIIEEIVFDVG